MAPRRHMWVLRCWCLISALVGFGTRLSKTPHLTVGLSDDSAPIAGRMRTLFELKNQGDDAAFHKLTDGLRSDSVLLRHEVAYVLGQMQHRRAIPLLTRILNDESEHCIVRHEAAEALAAIGDEAADEVLRSHADSASPEVSDTCRLALDTLAWKRRSREQTGLGAGEDGNHPRVNGKTGPGQQKFHSVDPAPALTSDCSSDNTCHGDGSSSQGRGKSLHDDPKLSVESLARKLRDRRLPLFERYRALFTLRDRGGDEAVHALSTAFEDPSAVFKHEVAFVLGQMQHPRAVACLSSVLKDDTQHAMVRHEAAEALGAISTPECVALLKRFCGDTDQLVRESCEVALDMCEQWSLGGAG